MKNGSSPVTSWKKKYYKLKRRKEGKSIPAIFVGMSMIRRLEIREMALRPGSF